MRQRTVKVDARAKQDIIEIYWAIELAGAPQSGFAYVQRIDSFIASLDLASERGTALDDIDPGLRSIPFESVVLAVRVRDDEIVVARVFHASQDWRKQLKREVTRDER